MSVSGIQHLMKAGRKFPVGHISRRKDGLWKKVAPGKWELVVYKKEGGKTSITMPLVRMKVTLTKDQLQNMLRNGHYSIISAGRNPAFPAEAKLDEKDPMFEKRHEKLRAELESKMMRYTEVVGHYGGTERSFIVHHSPDFQPPSKENAFMVHHKSTSEHQTIRELGKKFNQDSVIHVNKGTNELHYTTGKNEGKFHPGSGHEMKPLADDYYTEVQHPRRSAFGVGSASKFALNFDWGAYNPIEDAVMKSLPKRGQRAEKASKKMSFEDCVKMALKKEGGAAGLGAIKDYLKEKGHSTANLAARLKKVPSVEQHKHGDYVLMGIGMMKKSNPIPGLTRLMKAGKGEGSRGGRVIGHTRSGKPIYASNSRNKWREHHKDFTEQDHKDAEHVHSQFQDHHENEQMRHDDIADEHADERREREKLKHEKMSDDHFNASLHHSTLKGAHKTTRKHGNLGGANKKHVTDLLHDSIAEEAKASRKLAGEHDSKVHKRPKMQRYSRKIRGQDG